MTTVRDATIALMRAHGMTRIFGNPGSTELPMFRDFPADFDYVLGLQESVVIGMADGYAQATRNAALVNLHSSAGTGHALGNLFTAYKNRTPLVVTAGQQARGILPYEPFLYAEGATEFPRPFVKWACEPARAEDVPHAIARAYHVAMTPPCGPTFVSVPVDDWDRPCAPLTPRRVASRAAGDPALIAEIAEALASARNPALVYGAGVARDGAWDAAIALAERHAAAVWIAPFAARNPFPEDHRLFRGFLMPMRDRIREALGGHDVIVTVGGPLSLYHVDGEGPHLPDGARHFLCVDDLGSAACAPAGDAVVADARSFLSALLDGPAPEARTPPPPAPPPPSLDRTSLTDAWLLARIAALRPAGSIIVEEAPSSRGAMHDRLPITLRDGFYTCASGGLGHGMPAAVGIALARPGEKVIAIIGDGSAMYAIQALWSAADRRLPISFVIVNNRRYQALHGFGRLFGLAKPIGTELPGLDFCAIAEGQGVRATRVDNIAGIDAALAASFAADHPTLVDVQVAQGA
ncbi:benzoylformate decarboxylase [Sphingomonas baiyangensis]|uniref:Benzoylformate decarboxylase n=1 Tax=Sphingomonas baiyangensis TaxID=2572576 RepID=A0A4U1L397_9SPHN|nr:benzoylformate decarboxylase [Sphingomonas baiyangensis]TKD50673.1 benzoylformate decarboxylase [Sphingomonas baiyangensis]